MESYQLKKGEVIIKEGILTISDDNQSIRRNNIILSVILLAVFLFNLLFKPDLSEILVSFAAIALIIYFIGYLRGWQLSNEDNIPLSDIEGTKIQKSRSQVVVILKLNSTSKIRILRFNSNESDPFIQELEKHTNLSSS